jgi:hypothetical protein
MIRSFVAIVIMVGASSVSSAYIGNPITAGPTHIRVACSDLIAIGTVTELDREPTKFKLAPDDGWSKGMYTGTVTLSEVILGDKSLKSVKVAALFYYVTIDYDKIYKPQEHAPALKTFKKGREGVFYLMWNPAIKHYVLAHEPLFVEKADPVYKEELERTRHFVKLLSDSKANLQAKDETIRATTAALLIYRYRWPRWGMSAEKPIDVEESKLILGALAEAKSWYIGERDIRGISLEQCYSILGATAIDGWTSGTGRPALARDWLDKNKEKFRIKRFVWEK